jgi:sporulation protein YunB
MRRQHKISKILIVVLIAAVIIAAYFILDNAIRPTILSLTEARLRAIAVKAMNDAVRETVGSDVGYSDLIDIEKDDQGKIVLVSANAVMMNQLAASTAIAAQEKILNLGEQGIGIPIGTIVGGPLMTGRGPQIYVKFEPVGSVSTDFMTEFEDAGINQTRHKVYLVFDATVRILIGSSPQTVDISSQVLISDTIIIGEVPQSYFQGTQDQLLNLLPSDGS